MRFRWIQPQKNRDHKFTVILSVFRCLARVDGIYLMTMKTWKSLIKIKYSFRFNIMLKEMSFHCNLTNRALLICIKGDHNIQWMFKVFKNSYYWKRHIAINLSQNASLYFKHICLIILPLSETVLKVLLCVFTRYDKKKYCKCCRHVSSNRQPGL